MDERRHLLHADSAGYVPVRVHGLDDYERFREGPRRRAVELEDRRRPPRQAVFEDGWEGAVLQDEQFAQVPAEPEDLRLRTVDADALRPRLQETDLVRLALLHVAQDIVDMERRAVHRAHALRRVRDPVTGDDLDFETAKPSARVRMFSVHPHGPLEHVAEGEALPFEDPARRVRRASHQG